MLFVGEENESLQQQMHLDTLNRRNSQIEI